MNYSTEIENLETSIIPAIGDFIHPDKWNLGNNLTEGIPATNDGWPGSDFRLQGKYCDWGVNIKVTGRKVIYTSWGIKVRCQIEFVGDCELSTFGYGWLYTRI